MSRRVKRAALPPVAAGAGTEDRPERPARFGTASFDDLILINPHLRPADILALWRLAGPSARVH